jgi:hypothetical protein
MHVLPYFNCLNHSTVHRHLPVIEATEVADNECSEVVAVRVQRDLVKPLQAIDDGEEGHQQVHLHDHLPKCHQWVDWSNRNPVECHQVHHQAHVMQLAGEGVLVHDDSWA